MWTWQKDAVKIGDQEHKLLRGPDATRWAREYLDIREVAEMLRRARASVLLGDAHFASQSIESLVGLVRLSREALVRSVALGVQGLAFIKPALPSMDGADLARLMEEAAGRMGV